MYIVKWSAHLAWANGAIDIYISYVLRHFIVRKGIQAIRTACFIFLTAKFGDLRMVLNDS